MKLSEYFSRKIILDCWDASNAAERPSFSSSLFSRGGGRSRKRPYGPSYLRHFFGHFARFFGYFVAQRAVPLSPLWRARFAGPPFLKSRSPLCSSSSVLSSGPKPLNFNRAGNLGAIGAMITSCVILACCIFAHSPLLPLSSWLIQTGLKEHACVLYRLKTKKEKGS